MMISGIKLITEHPAISDKIRSYMLASEYEGTEVSVAGGLVRSGDRVLEIGGGCGFVSAFCAKEREAQVTTVEPNPRLWDLITKNHEANGVRVKLVQAAAGTHSGMTRLTDETDFWAARTVGDESLRITFEVPMIDINVLINNYSPLVLLMDCEGAEIELLAHANLRNVDRMMIEFHENVTGAAAISTTVGALKAQGFRCEEHSSVKVFRR